jgi:hypothetical protein
MGKRGCKKVGGVVEWRTRITEEEGLKEDSRRKREGGDERICCSCHWDIGLW